MIIVNGDITVKYRIPKNKVKLNDDDTGDVYHYLNESVGYDWNVKLATGIKHTV